MKQTYHFPLMLLGMVLGALPPLWFCLSVIYPDTTFKYMVNGVMFSIIAGVVLIAAAVKDYVK